MKYRVHRVSTHEQVASVTLSNGDKTEALVPCLEVELVPTDHSGSTVTLRFVGIEKIKTAQAEYKPDSEIELSRV